MSLPEEEFPLRAAILVKTLQSTHPIPVKFGLAKLVLRIKILTDTDFVAKYFDSQLRTIVMSLVNKTS
jgi:hypothetical protein